LAAAFVGVFLAGMAARGLFPSRSTPEELSTTGGRRISRVDAVGPGPARLDNGMPVGFERSEDGARAAAVAYVLAGQALLGLAPTEVPDAVRVFASSSSADAQVDDAQEQLGALRSALAEGSGPIRYVQSVLATRADAYTRARARVAVWSVGVLARVGAAQPQAGWTTSTFELVWERGDWKVWSENIAPGPAPLLNGAARPATNAEFERSLTGFTPWQANSKVATR
jgi:hypothetical protein